MKTAIDTPELESKTSQNLNDDEELPSPAKSFDRWYAELREIYLRHNSTPRSQAEKLQKRLEAYFGAETVTSDRRNANEFLRHSKLLKCQVKNSRIRKVQAEAVGGVATCEKDLELVKLAISEFTQNSETLDTFEIEVASLMSQ